MSPQAPTSLLFFDFETTGLPGPRVPVYPVQLAWILNDATGVTRESGDFLIQPEGWEIPESATKVHGITTDIAREFGHPLSTVLDLFSAASTRAGRLVAHNVNFDRQILLDCYARAGRQDDFHRTAHAAVFCTMRAAATMCGIRSGRIGLSAAFARFIGSRLEGAHNAAADTRACLQLFYALTARTTKLITAPEPAPTPSDPSTVE